MAATSTMSNTRLVWHRRDLRLHDNELYHDLQGPCVSLFVFDTHYFQQPKPSLASPTEYDTVWCGPFALAAMIDAVTCLRCNLRKIGGELIIRRGDPAVIVPQVANEMGACEIYFGIEPATYEQGLVRKLQQHYHVSGREQIKLKGVAGYSLYHPDDLPSDPDEWDQLAHPKQSKSKKKNKKQPQQPKHNIKDSMLVDVSPERFKGMCRIMGDFRTAARSSATVRKELNAPTELVLPPSVTSVEKGGIPTLDELTLPLSNTSRPLMGMGKHVVQAVVNAAKERYEEEGRELRTEDAALERLNWFISSGKASTADRSRVDVGSNNDSSRMSVHLALGTISPRTIYWKVKDRGDGCNWLASHLEMRDFFLHTCFANGSRIFQKQGIRNVSMQKKKQKKTNNEKEKDSEINWKAPHEDSVRWTRWATGNTQLPLLDAAMRELLNTGYCSNRVRQNLASFLTKDLEFDWRAGAEWFQFLLEDHCVAANYGNWMYFSGVGTDPKNRHFRSVSQMKRYDDPNGSYVRKWVPILSDLDNAEAVFRPWDFRIEAYDSPIVDPKSQYTWQDSQLLQTTGKLLEQSNEKKDDI